MNQQTFFKPQVPLKPLLFPLNLLLFSHYSHTWESSLHWLCQFTQFSFISQLLSFDLLPLRYWISSPGYRLSAKHTYLFPFSLDSTWFPAAFDTADHRCWHLRQCWSGFHKSILSWFFSLSLTLWIFSRTLHIIPFLYIFMFLPHTCMSFFCLHILFLQHLSLLKIHIFIFSSLFNISIWCFIDMSSLND